MQHETSLIQTEISRGWMEKNPEIAVRHLLAFFEECSTLGLDRVAVDVKRPGFVTYTAKAA